MNDLPAVSCLGTSALLFDPGGTLSLSQQQRIWALSQAAAAWPEIREAVPCLNNLLLYFADAPPRDIDDAAIVGRHDSFRFRRRAYYAAGRRQ